MTVAYACDLNVFVCVNFGDEILLSGEELKSRGKFKFFLKNGKIVNCYYGTGYNPEFF